MNRRLRVLEIDGEPAAPGDDVRVDGRSVGRVTSAVAGCALAYVRAEVALDAPLDVAGRPARIRDAAEALGG